MNNKTTIKRQLIAGCLLMVFLFISVAKLLHSHENFNTGNFSSYIEQVEKSTDCSICDYHFTKDADVPLYAFQKLALPVFSENFFFYQSERPSSIGLSYADRGPPALV